MPSLLLLGRAALITWIAFTTIIYCAQITRQSWTNDHVLVETPYQGSFSGLHIDDNVEAFLGIRYAQAPVGALRFAKTKPLEKYGKQDIQDATSAGAACLQPVGQVTSNTSEDCLFLNIYRPRSASIQHKMPVLFWIHGGSWTVGSGTLPLYNGTSFIQRSLELDEPVILVTINYRLGLFGFLGGAAMYEANLVKSAALNAGFHDQREALRWVRQNVGSFGGDVDRVTIWGESAGANSVAAQMLAKSGNNKGLFARAIMQSGSQVLLPRFDARAAGPSLGLTSLLQAVGCVNSISPLDCLRQTDSSHLEEANAMIFKKGYIFNPVRDQYFVQEEASKQLKDGRFNRSIAFIHGTNLDDGTQSAAPYAPMLTSDSAFESVVSIAYGEEVATVLPDILRLWPNIAYLGEPNRPYYFGASTNDTFYPLNIDGSTNQYKRLASFFHDTLFEAGRRQHLLAASKFGVPVWSYRFAQPTPENASFVMFQDTPSLGVQHASELPYVFGHHPKAANLSQQPIALQPYIKDCIIKETTATMTAAWIRFATHGDPNGEGIPTWPLYFDQAKTKNDMGTELIWQPEGINTQPDSYHWKQTQWILDHTDSFGM